MTVNQVLMHFRKRSNQVELLTIEGETPVQNRAGTENPNAMPSRQYRAGTTIQQLPTDTARFRHARR